MIEIHFFFLNVFIPNDKGPVARMDQNYYIGMAQDENGPCLDQHECL